MQNMINIKSRQMKKTFYKMFLCDLGQPFEDVDNNEPNDDRYRSYRYSDQKLIQEEKKKESKEQIAQKVNFQHDQNNQLGIVNEINISNGPFKILHNHSSVSYLYQILTNINFDKNYVLFMHSSHEIALELIEPEKKRENYLSLSKFAEHESREGVRRRNLIRNFGRKCQTFAKKYGSEMLKLFYKSILDQRPNHIPIEQLSEAYSIARRFREWISKLRTEMDGLHKLKKVLSSEEDEQKIFIIFKKSLQFVMLYFIKNRYDEWVTSSNLFGDKNIPNDYKQDMESLIRDPINFKWHI